MKSLYDTKIKNKTDACIYLVNHGFQVNTENDLEMLRTRFTIKDKDGHALTRVIHDMPLPLSHETWKKILDEMIADFKRIYPRYVDTNDVFDPIASLYPETMIMARCNGKTELIKKWINSLYGAKQGIGLLEIDKVIFNDPATIVMWKDGTKTVVKATNEDFDPEKGLAMAITKKALGNKGNYFETIKKWTKNMKVLNVREAEKKKKEYNREINLFCTKCKVSSVIHVGDKFSISRTPVYCRECKRKMIATELTPETVKLIELSKKEKTQADKMRKGKEKEND